MGHHFVRYRLGKFSSSLLDYKIILKRHRSLEHESSFTRQLSHERFVILAKSLLSPRNRKYYYMAIRKVVGQRLSCWLGAKNIAWPFSSALMMPWDLEAQSPVELSLLCFFLSDLHKYDSAGNNLVLQSPSHLTLLPKCWRWWWLWTFPAATGPSPYFA